MTPAHFVYLLRGKAGASTGERRFIWFGVELDGRRRRGRLVTHNAATARARLAREGVVVLAMRDGGPAKAPQTTARQITAFTRQLAGLLRAGLPLAQALDAVAHIPARSAIPHIADALARALADGERFTEALARFPAQFDAPYRHMVAVGEASGALASVLARVAREREAAAALRAKLRAALIYPAVVLLLALAITGALLVWVVPTFQQVFESFGGVLPAPTRAVLAVSRFLTDLGAPLAAALGASYLVAARAVRGHRAARHALARVLLAAPVIGRPLSVLAAVRWSRALGTLLGAGVPLADALASLRDVTGNAVFDAASADIAARLGQGERLAAAMRATRRFPAAFVAPIALAEEAGALDSTLLDMAALAEQELNEAVAMLASLAEPLVVIVLGALVGALVVALYLPVIELGNVV